VKAKTRAKKSTKTSRGSEAGSYIGSTEERLRKVAIDSSATPLADCAQLQSPSRPRLVRRTLQHNVYDFLREGLMSGRFAPGERLTVRGVAAWIGTSVMPVREAFRRLTTEGALEPLSSGATRVPVLDFVKLQDLMEIRVTVEGLAARRAATRVTEAEYQDLCAINEAVLKAAARRDQTNEAHANERFHFAIYRAARSDELLRIIEHLWLQMGPYLAWLLRRGLWPAHQREADAYRHHKGLLDALRLRDPAKAEMSLRADLSLASQRLIEVGSRLPARQALA
jgi:DNA-binding GntR family transcriptional regulator